MNVYDGAADVDSFTSWKNSLTVPTLFKFTEEEIEAVFGQQQNTAILFRTEDDDDAAFTKVYAEGAQTLKGKVLFSYSDGSVSIQEKLAEFMGVEKDSLPVLMIIKPEDMLKYRYDGSVKDLTAEALAQWVDDVKSGKAAPHLKSEPIPENNDKSVKVIVGKNFKEIALDENRDVFVKFYAPWCGHCKKLAPVWEELGDHFASNENIVIAKFDATANEAEGVNVRGYPTLIFYPKGGADPVTYEGDRDLDGFKKWLNENSEVLKAASASTEATKEEL